MGCNSCDPNSVTLLQGEQGIPGNDGQDGANGSDGADGIYGGYSSDWAFSTLIAVGASAGTIRFNNATPSSVTAVYVSTENADGVDLTSMLSNFSSNSRIRIFKEDDNTKFALFEVTAVTNIGGSPVAYELTVTHIASNSTFSDTDPVVLSYVEDGNDGPQGDPGVPVLHNDTTAESHTQQSLTLIGSKSYTVAADQLTTYGDKLVITSILTKSSRSDNGGVQIKFNGNWFTSKISWIDFLEGMTEMRVEAHITRVANTLALMEITYISTGGLGSGNIGFVHENTASLGFLNFTGATHDIEILGGIESGAFTNGAGGVPSGNIQCEQLTVEYHKKI